MSIIKKEKKLSLKLFLKNLIINQIIEILINVNAILFITIPYKIDNIIIIFLFF